VRRTRVRYPEGIHPIDLSPTGIERLRRSVAMLAPFRADGLSREHALDVLAELQRLQRRCGHLETGVAGVLAELEDRVRRLLDSDEG
jgi:hypothetical protein